jgi:hypothetical protein
VPGGGLTTSSRQRRPSRARRLFRDVSRDVSVMWRSRARGRAGRSVGAQCPARGRGAGGEGPCRRLRGVGGARGRERAGPTRSHPEPGRDPAQRRRVLWGRPHGRRGRRGHPPPSESRRREDDTSDELIATSSELRAHSYELRATSSELRAHSYAPIAENQHPPRGGAAAARWAHNPKVGGSNPPPATRRERRHH